MAADEALLERVQRSETAPILRLYAWDPPSLSLGHAQPYADVDPARLKASRWQVVRRLTGGRAILHTDEITYSVIAPAAEPRLAGSVLESYNRLAQALLRAARDLGLPVEMSADGAHAPASPQNPICFEVPSAYEITVGGKKLIGSAQARKQGGVLQHGSLPLHGDLRRIAHALTFPEESERAEAGERLLARATTVETVLGRRVEWNTAADAFAAAFYSELEIDLEEGEMSADERARTDELVAVKYAHASWTERV